MTLSVGRLVGWLVLVGVGCVVTGLRPTCLFQNISSCLLADGVWLVLAVTMPSVTE